MPAFLDVTALTDQFPQSGWRELRVLPSTGSTNHDVAEAARAGAQGGLVIVSPDQRAGRGRFERVWQSPPDSCVALSVLVRPRRPLEAWGWLSLLVGLAVTDGLRESAGLEAWLKWPNDVLLDERKTCGILCEVVAQPSPAAVLGIGLNIALDADHLPVPTATSVRLAGSDATAADVTASVLAALQRRYASWDAGDSLVDDYRARCSTLGRRVRVHLTEGDVVGTAVDVDTDGALIVEGPTGRRTFAAGDVVHLRPGE